MKANTTLSDLKKMFPDEDFRSVERLTKSHKYLINKVKTYKKLLAEVYSDPLFKPSGCYHDYLQDVANPKFAELAAEILEYKLHLKAAQESVRKIKWKIKAEIKRIKRAGAPIGPKQKENVYASGAFIVNYQTALELISKLTKLVTANQKEWRAYPSRKVVVDFKSV